MQLINFQYVNATCYISGEGRGVSFVFDLQVGPRQSLAVRYGCDHHVANEEIALSKPNVWQSAIKIGVFLTGSEMNSDEVDVPIVFAVYSLVVKLLMLDLTWSTKFVVENMESGYW
jgi:hypothetical protein